MYHIRNQCWLCKFVVTDGMARHQEILLDSVLLGRAG
jgi:hypothetical protein